MTEVQIQAPIPDGMPKSGRFWKSKQRTRSSAQVRKGILSHLSHTFEERQVKRSKENETKAVEREMKEETKAKILEKKAKAEERLKIRQANEFKSTSFQEIRPEKLKTMSKKQLRMIKKTVVNKAGQVTLLSNSFLIRFHINNALIG